MEKLKGRELAKLKTAKTEKQWDRICAEIRKARNGRQPPDWWERVVASGVAREVASSWRPATVARLSPR